MGLNAPVSPRWMRGQSAAFDEPRTAVGNFMLTEGSGLGTIQKPPVATDITVEATHSFLNSNSSNNQSSKVESNRNRQFSKASTDSDECLTTPDSSFVQESYFNSNDDYLDRFINNADTKSNAFENDAELQYSVPHPVNAISHTFVSDKSMPTEMKWDYIIVEEIMLFSLPESAHKQKGFRDGFVQFLEHAEDEMNCSCAVLAIDKDGGIESCQISTFRFLGFALMSPDTVPECLKNLCDDFILMVSPFKFDSDSDFNDEF